MTADYHILTFLPSPTAASSRRLSKTPGKMDRPQTATTHQSILGTQSPGLRGQGPSHLFPRGLWTPWVLLYLLCLSVDPSLVRPPSSGWGDLAPSCIHMYSKISRPRTTRVEEVLCSYQGRAGEAPASTGRDVQLEGCSARSYPPQEPLGLGKLRPQ